MKSCRSGACRAILALALSAAPAAAQAVTTVLLEGDTVPGVGEVNVIAAYAVNSAGSTIVIADTDFPDIVSDGVILKDGALFLREGDPLALPAGASLGGFDSVTLDELGRASFNFDLDGTAGPDENSGVYRDGGLVVQEGAASNAAQLTPGTTYREFWDTKLAGAGHLLVVAFVGDPIRRAAVLFELDGSGSVISESALVQEGDVLPGQSSPITLLSYWPEGTDLNDAGELMFAAKLEVGSVIHIDDGLIAREGDPSPVPGRDWAGLATANVALNDSGQHAFLASLTGNPYTAQVLVRDGAVVVQRGDLIPSVAPYAIDYLGSGPIDLGDDGRVLWYGEWNHPDPDVDSGLFLDHELIVQEGVTTVGGQVVDEIFYFLTGEAKPYALSDNGRWVMFGARLADGTEGVFLVDTHAPPLAAFCFGDGAGTPCPCGNHGASGGGCANSSGQGAVLAASGSSSVAQDDLVLDASGLLPGQPALLFAGEQELNGGEGIPFGDGLRCAGVGVLRLGIAIPDGAGNASWGPGLAALAGFGAGAQPQFQGWYRDPAGGPCGAGFNLTNGFAVVYHP